MKKILLIVGLLCPLLVFAPPINTQLKGTTDVIPPHSTNVLAQATLTVGEADNIALAVGFLYTGTNASTQTLLWQSSMDGVNNWTTFDTWTMILVSNPLPVFYGPTNYTNLLPGVWQIRPTWSMTNAALSLTSYLTNVTTNGGIVYTNITTNTAAFPVDTNVVVKGITKLK
jgi:hypothetical protein